MRLVATVLLAIPAAAVLCAAPTTSCQRKGGGLVQTDADFAAQRLEMVKDQIAARGVRDPRVLAAMRKVARHRFVPSDVRSQAYEDHPLSIGHGQTITQPYIVAFMSEALVLKGTETCLEIGTGSGYQA